MKDETNDDAQNDEDQPKTMAETTTEQTKNHKRNDWSKRTTPKLLKGKEGKVTGDLRDLDKISTTDDESLDSGKDIFSMSEGEKGEKMNSYKNEERQAMKSPLRSSEMKNLESSGKSLLNEITGDLKSIGGAEGKHDFWMKKAFFRKHMGLS